MGLWVRVLRGLALAGLVLGGVFVGLVCRVVGARPATPWRNPHRSIVVEGNRRVEADTIRSYFRPEPGERLDAAKIDEGLQGAVTRPACSRTSASARSGGRLIVTVVENPVINRVAVRGQQARQGRAARAAKSSRSRAARCRAPTVQSDVQRIVEIYRRNGRYDVRVDAEDHRAAEQPRRSRVRDHRGRQDRRSRTSSSSATGPIPTAA